MMVILKEFQNGLKSYENGDSTLLSEIDQYNLVLSINLEHLKKYFSSFSPDLQTICILGKIYEKPFGNLNLLLVSLLILGKLIESMLFFKDELSF